MTITVVLRALALHLPLLALVGACTTETATAGDSSRARSGTSGSSGSSGASSSSGDDDPGDFVNTYCSTLVPCCPSSLAPTAPDTFLSYCTTALGRLLKGDFRSADGDACLAAVTTAAKSKDLCAVPSAFTTACGGVFVGTTKPVSQVKLGETCKGTIEASGYQTNADRDDVSSGGAVCDGIATYCEPTSMKCAAVKPTGATCTAIGDEMCGATGHCVYAKGTSTCQPLARTGAACTYSSDCLGYAPCKVGACGDVGLGLHSVASLVNGGACYTKL